MHAFAGIGLPGTIGHVLLTSTCSWPFLVQALPPRPCPKIPGKLLQDFSARGAVFVIAKKCEEIRRSKNLKRIDFANPARRKEVRSKHARISPILQDLLKIDRKPQQAISSALLTKTCEYW